MECEFKQCSIVCVVLVDLNRWKINVEQRTEPFSNRQNRQSVHKHAWSIERDDEQMLSHQIVQILIEIDQSHCCNSKY